MPQRRASWCPGLPRPLRLWTTRAQWRQSFRSLVRQGTHSGTVVLLRGFLWYCGSTIAPLLLLLLIQCYYYQYSAVGSFVSAFYPTPHLVPSVHRKAHTSACATSPSMVLRAHRAPEHMVDCSRAGPHEPQRLRPRCCHHLSLPGGLPPHPHDARCWSGWLQWPGSDSGTTQLLTLGVDELTRCCPPPPDRGDDCKFFFKKFWVTFTRICGTNCDLP